MIKNAFKHFALVLRHKRLVLWHCARCGLIWRGLVHDLSKFSPTEFFESVKYYRGNRSPIGACRRETGVSYAWLHHKGRNPHHLEYWCDPECKEQPVMPYPYAVECVCDKLAATKVYAGREYSEDKPLLHFERYGCKVDTNEKNLRFIREVFCDLQDFGEKHILNKNYMKRKYREIFGK